MSDSYIKHGFLAAVYEPWVQFEGTEWADCMTRLWEAYDCGIGSLWHEDEMDAMEKILRSWLDDAGASFFFEEGGMYDQEVLEARLAYPATVEYWKSRSEESYTKDHGGPETFAAVEASIPDWMRPPTDADVNKAKRERLLERARDLRKQLEKLEAEAAALA